MRMIPLLNTRPRTIESRTLHSRYNGIDDFTIFGLMKAGPTRNPGRLCPSWSGVDSNLEKDTLYQGTARIYKSNDMGLLRVWILLESYQAQDANGGHLLREHFSHCGCS